MCRGILAFLVLAAWCASASPAYPLRASANGRYLVDSNGAPFLVIGDAPHSILANLKESNVNLYLTNRAAYGVNCIWIELLCDSATGGYGSEPSANYGKDINGNNPFTNTLSGGYYDFTAPNPAYWSNVDLVVSMAATNGIQCFFTPCDWDGFPVTLTSNSSNSCYAYGQFLGNRYANSPNIFWNMGNDFGPDNGSGSGGWANATADANMIGIAKGILSKDANHPMTIELGWNISQSLDDPRWWPVINVNGCYSYYPQYGEAYVCWNTTNMPVLFLEGNYEYENDTGSQPYQPLELRMQEYWSILGGCLAGHMYGNGLIWPFAGGWNNPTNLFSAGITQLQIAKNLFTSRPWYNLVPDQSHAVLTAGYGLFETNSLYLTTNNYVTAAEAANSNTVIAYIPQGNASTVTIAMSKISGSTATAWWYNVTNGVATKIGSYSTSGSQTFTAPDTNDWVLVLDDASQNYPPPGTPAKVSLSLEASGGNVYDLTVTGMPGQAIALQYTTNLDTSWQALGSGTIGSSGTTSYYVIAMSSAIFFRALNQ